MNIDTNMIDKQLRVPGMIFKAFMKFSSEVDFRRFQKRACSLLGKKIKGIHCSEEWISRKQDGSHLRICIYRSLTPSKAATGLLWMHGGGYAVGLPESSIGLIKRFIIESGCVVVAPDYCLSLDSPYPAALNDCHEALLWMKEHSDELGIRDDQLMVGGESAGGGLAAALVLYERDHDSGVKIAFQIPLYPMIDDRMTNESAKENNAPVWDSRANLVAWDLYLSDFPGKDVPIYAAPARATDYFGLPPAVTFVGDLEPFRDETIEYVRNLREAGVPVDFELFAGCYHSFDKINPYARVSQRALSFLMKSFKYAVDHYFAEQIRNS